MTFVFFIINNNIDYYLTSIVLKSCPAPYNRLIRDLIDLRLKSSWIEKNKKSKKLGWSSQKLDDNPLIIIF